MPELIEVEQYRSAVDPLVGERLTGVDLVDPQFVRPDGAGASLQAAVGDRLVAARRHGKLLILDFGNSEPEMTMGLRFGMTGRLLVDGKGPIDRLEFSSGRNDPAWDRVRLSFGTTVVAVRDPRRLGSIEAEPDEERLGVDALQISAPLLAGILRGRRAPLKATLLDQQLVAGLGNLLVDEILWAAGRAPQRAGGTLDEDEVAHLAVVIVNTVSELMRRGGSHTGDTFGERHTDGCCPRDGHEMMHDRVGGRSTWWCPHHQR